jgi:alpha-1,3-rhamnosyl/mannosyltransferase
MRVLLSGKPVLGSRTGIGWYTFRLAEALQARDEVEAVGLAVGGRVVSLAEVSTIPARAESWLPALLRRSAQNVVPVEARTLLWSVRGSRLRHALHGWSLFHETNYVSPRLPVPLVTTVCDMSYVRCPQYMPRPRRQWLKAHLVKCLTRSPAIITISRFTRDELLNFLPVLDPARLFTTPLGVDDAVFHPEATAGETSRVRERYGLPAQFVLYLGTLEPRKNLHGLLTAYALLPEECRRQFPLVLGGMTGWRQSYFWDAVMRLREQGFVRLLGYVPQEDVPALMRAATVFCFPSLYEGFGLPALEAAACGTPVLSSTTSSLPEVLGDAAEYVDPHSADSIAAGLLRLLGDADYRKSLASRGPVQAASFTWQRCASETVNAYRVAA